ncbi:MAG: sulfatase [Myxococcota bacterium]
MVLLWASGCREPAAGGAPNLVLVTIDTLRVDPLGPWGGDPGLTPALSAFAADSTVFDQAISAAPWTKPAVTTIFTSQLPRDHGVTQWEPEYALPPETPTLTTALRAAGYETSAVVSHLALDPEEGNHFEVGFDRFDRSVLGLGHPHVVTSAEPVADLALAELDHLRPPFFLWTHFFDAHANYLPHPEHPTGDLPYDLYQGEIAWIDDQLGRLLDAASDPDTVVVVMADHGEEFYDHGGVEHTHTLYDELVHVPLIVHRPGDAPSRVGVTVGSIDVAPTILAALEVPAPSTFTGEPLTWTAAGPSAVADRTVFSETSRQAALRSVTRGAHKLVHDLATGGWTLFDRSADPGETVDASAAQPEVRAELEARLRETYPEIAR